MDAITACRVCLCGTANPFARVDNRDYWSCPTCTSIFLDDTQLPDRQTEYQQYLLHNNDPKDPGYQAFLNKLAEPLLKKLEPGMKGLDFGCGAGPALGLMLADMGYEMNFYDPFFFQPDTSVLHKTYDFIVCSEVAEHFHQPSHEFARLDAMLNPNGWLGIMTCFQTDDLKFANWHYRRDLTHVVFYREETFRYLAWQFGWDCQIPAKNIVLLQKSGSIAPFSRRKQIPERRPR
ncbi:MAG TPA: methyltransferase domain-containing protein [Phycisphaerales bacterium]|nr:methyltransferase domain-containing protein [Phycisphaerales bacterium]